MLEERVECKRCGRLCRRSAPIHEDAELLQRTTSDDGFCPDCAVTAFLLSVAPARQSINRIGPQCLRDERIRREFAEVLVAGKADMTIDEVNWDTVISNWALPFPKGKRRRSAP